MQLKALLKTIKDKNEPILLSDSRQDWEAEVLLEELPEPRLKTQVHMQAGLYIAEINGDGYLGRVLYRIKSKD